MNVTRHQVYNVLVIVVWEVAIFCILQQGMSYSIKSSFKKKKVNKTKHNFLKARFNLVLKGKKYNI